MRLSHHVFLSKGPLRARSRDYSQHHRAHRQFTRQHAPPALHEIPCNARSLINWVRNSSKELLQFANPTEAHLWFAIKPLFKMAEDDFENTTDPWCWTINQVAMALSNLGIPESTIKKFEDNEVDGEVLLSALDLQSLKDEIRVPTYGQRVKIWNLVERFRRSSTKYRFSQCGEGQEPQIPEIRPFLMDKAPPRKPLRLLDGGNPMVIMNPLSHNEEFVRMTKDHPAVIDPGAAASAGADSEEDSQGSYAAGREEERTGRFCWLI